MQFGLKIIFFSVLFLNLSYAKEIEKMIRVSGSTQEFLFHPAKLKSYQQFAFIHLFVETLVDINSSGIIVAGAAKKWQILDNGKTYKFNIDDHAKFHDGSKIKAADIVHSFTQHLEPQFDSILKVYLETILENPKYDQKTKKCSSIYAEGDNTVILKLKGPYPPLLNDLAQAGFGIIPINFDEKKPIGSGPYKFDSATKDGIKKLVVFEEFWREKPKNKGFTFQIIREKSDIIKAFNDNKIDVTLGAPVDLVESGRPQGIDFQYLNGLVSTNIYLNGRSTSFKSQVIRNDFHNLINGLKEDKTLFTPYDITINTYLPNGIMPKNYYDRKNESMTTTEFKEKHKIANAHIKVIIPKHIFTERFITKFKNLLSEIGFTPTYLEDKGKAYLDPIENGEFDMVFIPFMGLGNDPDGYLAMLDPKGFLKNSDIKSHALIESLDKVRFSEIQDFRMQKYSEYLMKYEKENHVIPLLQQHLPFLFRHGISVPDFNFNNYSILRDFFWNK